VSRARAVYVYVYEDHRGNVTERAVSPGRARRAFSPGDRAGAWTVLEYAGRPRGRPRGRPGATFCLCRCECGTEQLVPSNNLTSGASTRCKACADAAIGAKLRRTTPYVCQWCARDYTNARNARRARRARRKSGGGGKSSECDACARRANPGRNGRAPCGYPLRRGGTRPLTDHACGECCAPRELAHRSGAAIAYRAERCAQARTAGAAK